MLSVHLVGGVARLVSILAVYDRSRVLFDALSHEKGHIICLWGSLWRLFGLNTGEIRTERSCFMYEKVMVECVCHCCISFWVHVRFAAAFRVVKGGKCFGTSRSPGGVRNV